MCHSIEMTSWTEHVALVADASDWEDVEVKIASDVKPDHGGTVPADDDEWEDV